MDLAVHPPMAIPLRRLIAAPLVRRETPTTPRRHDAKVLFPNCPKSSIAAVIAIGHVKLTGVHSSHRRLLGRFRTPDCPVFSGSTGKHVEIGFWRDRFDEFVERIRFDGVSAAGPVKPRALDNATRRQMSASREENKFRCLSERVTKANALQLFAPDEQRRRFEIPRAH